MKVLLTGGAGYIGSNVTLSLIDSGHKVHIIDNLSTGNANLIPKEAIFTKCNINDYEKVSNILSFNQFDILMHFAGYIQVEESMSNPNKYFENNTDNAITLFKICKENNLDKVIFSSTAAAYGLIKNNELIDENSELKPQNPYAQSKINTEKYLLKNKDDFNFIILRYFNVAGADPKLRSGQLSKTSTHLIKILSEVATGKRKSVEIYGKDYNTKDGTAIRDYIHVSDLADIHVEIAKYLINHRKSNIFNCGYGKGFSVMEVVNTANKITGNKINYKFVNRRSGDVEKLISNPAKIKDFINWTPKFNDLEYIVSSSIEWEKKFNEKNI